MKLPKNLTKYRDMGFSVPATLILTLAYASVLWFFVIAMAEPATQPYAIVFSLGLLFIFASMLHTGRVAFWRRLFFVLIALFFFPTFIALLIEARGSMFVTDREVFLNQTPMCHIVIPMTILPYLVDNVFIFPAKLQDYFASIYSMIIIWLTASVTLGRGWCSWVCFYGGWDDGCSRIRKKPLFEIRDPNGKLRYLNFAVLIFVALASLATLTAVYCTWLCPFKMVTEFSEPSTFENILAMVLMVLGFFGLAIVLPALTRKRTQCMSLCPFGAFQSLVDRVSPYRVRIDTETCTKCGLCVDSCPTLSLSKEGIEAGTGTTLITCTKCGECMSVCPKQAIRYEFAWVKGTPVKGAFERLGEKVNGTGIVSRFARACLVSVRQILSARALLVTAGMIMGSIIISNFGPSTLQRLAHLVTAGSFLLK